MIDLSVIIPAYITSTKCTEDLAILVNKLANQLVIPRHELIVVNDGSMVDLSFCEIVGATVINNPTNMGVAVARNQGIDNSKGKWIVFIDADDDIPDDFVSIIESRIDTDADIIQFKSKHEDGNICYPEPCAWGKMILNDWIGTSRFDPLQLIGEEDTLFLAKDKRVVYDDRILYLHRQSANPNSLMKRFWRHELPRRQNTTQYASEPNKVLTKNAFYCKKCQRLIESKSVHDYQKCDCGNFTDGGLDYIRRGGNPEDMEDRCEWKEQV